MIDKYVKHFCYDGALVVRAPCQVEVKGSHFDDNLNVDKATNHYCSSMIDSKTDSESPEEKDSKEQLQVLLKETSETIGSMIASEKQKERQVESDLYESEDEWPVDEKQSSPVHILLYGKSYLKTDSFSVVNHKDQQHVRTF